MYIGICKREFWSHPSRKKAPPTSRIPDINVNLTPNFGSFGESSRQYILSSDNVLKLTKYPTNGDTSTRESGEAPMIIPVVRALLPFSDACTISIVRLACIGFTKPLQCNFI